MTKKMCQQDDCKKEAISFSDFCGEHSDADEIVGKLNTLKKGEYSNLTFSDIALEGLRLSGLDLPFLSLLDVEIQDCTFDDCNFDCAGFTNAYFTDCKFSFCSFKEAVEFQSCDFSKCEFFEVQFLEATINQSVFQESTQFKSLTFTDGNLTGAMFHTVTFEDVSFDDSHFNQTSFHDSSFRNSQIQASSIYKTSFEDVSFWGALFKEVNNDFEEIDSFKLCIFQDTKFEQTPMPDDIAYWNALNETSIDFYKRVIRQVDVATNQDGISSMEHLYEMSIALEKLRTFYSDVNGIATVKDKFDREQANLKTQVTDIYRRLMFSARDSGDLGAFAKVAEHLSNTPEMWLTDVRRSLPMPIALPTNESRLKLVFHTSDTSLQKLHRIISKLNDLEQLLVGDNRAIQIQSVRTGSIIIEIGSNVQLLIFLVYSLYKGADLYFSFQKKVLENEKLKLEIAEKKGTSKKNELEELQKEKLKQEIQLLKDQQFKLLVERTKVDPQKLLPEPTQEAVLDLGMELTNEADSLDLYADVFEEVLGGAE